MSLREAILYLAELAMFEPKKYAAVCMYYIEGKSPADIAAELGLGKFIIRGPIQRVYEKARSHKAAKKAVEASLRILPKLPRTEDGRCPFCGRRFASTKGLRHHVLQKHLKRWLA